MESLFLTTEVIPPNVHYEGHSFSNRIPGRQKLPGALSELSNEKVSKNTSYIPTWSFLKDWTEQRQIAWGVNFASRIYLSKIETGLYLESVFAMCTKFASFVNVRLTMRNKIFMWSSRKNLHNISLKLQNLKYTTQQFSNPSTKLPQWRICPLFSWWASYWSAPSSQCGCLSSSLPTREHYSRVKGMTVSNRVLLAPGKKFPYLNNIRFGGWISSGFY